MSIFLFWTSLILLVLFATVLTTLPVLFLVLLFSVIFFGVETALTTALFSGLLLDALTLRPVGASSLFFLLFVFLVFLYESKFETATIPFILFASFLGSFFYVLLAGLSNPIQQALFTALLGCLVFLLLRRLTGRRRTNTMLPA